MVRNPAPRNPATERQLSFIVSLATERGWTYEAATNTLKNAGVGIDLATVSKSAASELITSLKDQPKQAAAPTAPKRCATEKQVTYLVSLADRAGWDVEDTKVTDFEGRVVELTELAVKVASELIDQLRDAPRARRAKTDPRIKITEDGMYRLDDTIYKVQVAVHGSGHLYAKRLVIDAPAVRDADGNVVAPTEAHFERDESAVRKLRPEHRLTAEDAKAFGDLYGMCVRCAATLTDEESIARGTGPVCAGKI